jgi:hypothetical protein
MRKFLLLVVILLVLLVAALPASADNGPEKFCVLHIDGQGNTHLIFVTEPARQAHIAHGDTLKCFNPL